MKKLITILCASLMAVAATGQVTFTLPALTDAQKYQTAAWQWNYSYLIQMTYAKSLGKPLEDVATFVGDIFKTTWDKEAGFEGFVKGMLYNWVIYTPDGTVEILDQSNSKVVVKVTKVFPELKEKGTINNVSYEEYLKFFDICISRLADYMGSKYMQKETAGDLIVTFEKK